MDPHFQLPPPCTSTQCHLSLLHRTFPVAPRWVLIYWKLLESFLLFPAPLPPPPAPVKSPLNSIVMQTASPKRARARCRLRRGWASNAAITSGGEGGWIIIKASPLPLMWTCLINTRLQGEDGGMDGWRMRGKGAVLFIYLQAGCSVATPWGRGGGGRGGGTSGHQEVTVYEEKWRKSPHRLCPSHVTFTWFMYKSSSDVTTAQI